MIYNGKIKFTNLNIDEKGTLKFQIGVECCGFLATSPVVNIDNIYEIKKLLKTVDVKGWETLPAKYVRIKAEKETITAIGNIIKDEWITFKGE